ncbi:murein hydrolase activator EnvC family protein [Saccharothrix violaceirubra]|uniref:Murein DD-endopeptidase MepM/ murein hydrolase activator NlpD n=1 Tax=Saccharothrix violaceirubra TaxID=413306 RepID=A0A7W7SZR1_9PSEU|nr:M23 family metallopeptidase [Saccharothrix violaceirubra]MBB4963952.1 murein DD-endopeptidase MepM/ murein hydrolase activator NlpD [Saccharothrix violaceirubra]
MPLTTTALALAATLAVSSLAAPTQSRPHHGVFTWPLRPPHEVVRPFVRPPTPYEAGHRGVDLAALPGAEVLAAGVGTVAHAGQVAGRPVISIDHPNGLRTTYEPVAPTVTLGQPVDRGTPIGTLLTGHEGCPRPACLHWGVRRKTQKDAYLNPLHLIARPKIRLLPLPRSRASSPHAIHGTR